MVSRGSPGTIDIKDGLRENISSAGRSKIAWNGKMLGSAITLQVETVIFPVDRPHAMRLYTEATHQNMCCAYSYCLPLHASYKLPRP